jgi:cell wall-associated NlpC family hydrolase
MIQVAKYVGIPYKPHGRNPQEGLDCYGLALCVFADRGIRLPDAHYTDTDTETNKRVMETLEATIPNTPLSAPEAGCIIEFTVLGEPAHIGIYIGRGEFIHASRKTGVVVEKLYRYEKRVKGYYRVTA